MGGPLGWKDKFLLDWFYRRKLEAFSQPAQRVGWLSKANQDARFRSFLAIGDLQGTRVLDVGCGLGCFYGYLRDQDWTGSYTGFDRLKDMVAEAQARFPEVRFEARNIAENPPVERWDWVFMSGLFNHKVRDNWGWIRQVAGTALDLAEQGIGFNLLADSHPDPDPDFFYASKKDLGEFAESLAPGRWRHGPSHVPDDLTIFLYKQS